jgi:uncharacterized protein YprB with RNaseH-like and TPR domain
MDQTAAALLVRRLERFRAAGPVPVPPLPAVAPNRARQLASELGADVVETAHGAVVVFDSLIELPLDRAALGRMPYGVVQERPLVCLDTETTGLATGAGTLAFLVGIGTWTGSQLRVRQLLLPDHALEPALLSLLADSIPADASLVTYNGRSFDWPLLMTRYRLHRRDPPVLAGHVDLLHISRQLWKHRLGNARLATVEHAICRVRRTNDLPGALIPERYFAYLRDRRGEQLRGVVEHNRQDVVSLALLLGALGRLAEPGGWHGTHPGDVSALGRAYARAGQLETALDCLESALGSSAWRLGAVVGGGSTWRRLASDRARMLARLGRREEAVLAWVDLGQRGGPGAATAWLHVARHREHFERDVAGALDACAQAAAAAERSRLWGRPAPSVERDLAWRMARLRRRLRTAATKRATPRAA